MTPKGKQDYVRHITERAREFMESSRKRKKKKVENERVGELLESSRSKGKKEEERMRELLESGSEEKEKEIGRASCRERVW